MLSHFPPYGLCWATICLHLHTHIVTHTHSLAANTYTSIVSHWRRLIGTKFLQTQQVTYRLSVCSVQDLSRWQSSKTGRGPLEKGWRDDHKPIMCSYKRVQCSFEVYGFQTKTEEFIHRVRQSLFSPHHAFSLCWCKEGWILIWSAINVTSPYRCNTMSKNLNLQQIGFNKVLSFIQALISACWSLSIYSKMMILNNQQWLVICYLNLLCVGFWHT